MYQTLMLHQNIKIAIQNQLKPDLGSNILECLVKGNLNNETGLTQSLIDNSTVTFDPLDMWDSYQISLTALPDVYVEWYYRDWDKCWYIDIMPNVANQLNERNDYEIQNIL